MKKCTILFPRDGDMLNERDGELLEDGSLSVPVKVISDQEVYINGLKAAFKDGLYQASVSLKSYENTVTVTCGKETETLKVYRLIFKLLGANPSSAFVSFIYALTGLFLNPFRGIFPSAVGEGITTHSVLEPSVIIGMIVYALIAYGIVVLIDMAANRKKRTEYSRQK
jgi:hypothetical protein